MAYLSVHGPLQSSCRDEKKLTNIRGEKKRVVAGEAVTRNFNDATGWIRIEQELSIDYKYVTIDNFDDINLRTTCPTTVTLRLTDDKDNETASLPLRCV